MIIDERNNEAGRFVTLTTTKAELFRFISSVDMWKVTAGTTNGTLEACGMSIPRAADIDISADGTVVIKWEEPAEHFPVTRALVAVADGPPRREEI